MAKKVLGYNVVDAEGKVVRSYMAKDHDDAKAEASRYCEGREGVSVEPVKGSEEEE